MGLYWSGKYLEGANMHHVLGEEFESGTQNCESHDKMPCCSNFERVNKSSFTSIHTYMHACMDMHVWINGWMYAWICMHGWMDVCM